MTNKIYYKIGAIASRFDVNTSLIRYWEQEFDFIRPKKNNKGTRLYTNKDIDNFEIIYYLIKEKGMTIQGVKDYIVNRKGNKSMEKLEVIVTLKRTRKLLAEIREVLSKKAEI